jgi:serine phosphatase RsbU (regulator of sigma subunit)
MNANWLEELLPREVLTPRAGILWLLFFTLFPLAYVGGVVLELNQERPARIEGAQDRMSAIRIASQFAKSKGYDVTGWHEYAVASTHDNLLAYYESSKQPEALAASLIAPARELQVLFRSGDLSHEFRVYLSMTGQVTGYEFGKSSKAGAGDTDDESGVNVKDDSSDEDDSKSSAKTGSDQEAEALARRVLSANAALHRLVKLGAAKVRANAGDAMRREVTWDEHPGGANGLTLHITASVRDSQVVGEHVSGSAGDASKPRKAVLRIIFDTVYGFFLAFCAIYAIYRYAKRTLQKEVSHLRTLVVAGLFAVSYGTMAYALGWDLIAVHVSGATFAKIQIIASVAACITFAIMGLLAGIGYGSGEGELREAYPGKLTSLDALLAGRIFSRNVAASVLFGAAAAGWLLLCQQAAGEFFSHNVDASRNDAVRFTFARMPWVTLLVGRQYDALLVAVAGLLLPAAFLMRKAARRKRRFFWLIVFALFAVLHDAGRYYTLGGALTGMAVFAAALLLPFFAFDLLAAIVGLSALSFVTEIARLSAVFQVWTDFALTLAVVGAAALIAAAYLALRGRGVREEAVRPQYAKNLVERMALQAEVLAAREAQLRLLPQAVPELPGIQFAACCLPAREVGGDFYDFFRLDANRVGIFIAQGGEQGLASALCIALAKGVLMHASLGPNSPTEVLLKLESSIAELLERGSGGGISFAYGVLDVRRNLLNYARLGASPRFVIYLHGTGLASSAHLERVVTVPGRSKSAPQIYEGTVQAQQGDHLIFFTGGVSSLRSRRVGKVDYQWLDFLVTQLKKSDAPLQTSLVSVLSKYQGRASEDLTAVVMRVVESRAIAQEVVA